MVPPRKSRRQTPGTTRSEATREAVAQATRIGEASAAAAGIEPAPRARAGDRDPFTGELRKREILPLLVLHFMRDAPSYGNQLMERISAVTAGVVSVNPNTMYPLLRQLEQRGLIVGRWEHPQRRSRRYYSLTEEGRAEYDRLVVEVRPFLDSIARSIGEIVERGIRAVTIAQASRQLALAPAAAFAAWVDVDRWDTFVDGFARVEKIDDSWPGVGSELVWQSVPGGRGTVTERVTAHEPPSNFQTHVREERLEATQGVLIEAEEVGSRIVLSLAYELTASGPLTWLTDVLFIRRAEVESLERTLARFAAEAGSGAAL